MERYTEHARENGLPKLLLIFFIIHFFPLTQFVYAQEKKDPQQIVVGQKCPDLIMNNLVNFSSTPAKISDFKGKLLILDFWASYCVPCIEMFPRLDSLQKHFYHSVQIIGITSEGGERITRFLQKIGNINKMDPPVSMIKDSVFVKLFPHKFVPHYVWINPDGMIQAITSQEFVTANYIDSVIANREFRIPMEIDNKQVSFKTEFPFLLDTSIGSEVNLIYHGICTHYIPGLGSFTNFSYINTFFENRRITAMNFSPVRLYQFAYGNRFDKIVGMSNARTIIRLKDKACFEKPPDMDRESWQKNYLYCYELILPGIDSNRKFSCMQEDLRKIFGYDATIKKRKVKCLLLQRTGKVDKLKTKGGAASLEDGPQWFYIKNQSICQLIFWLNNKYMYSLNEPILDETKYYGNIDLEINAKLSDIAQVNSQLKKFDLKFIQAEREIDMLIISEKK